MIQVSLLGAAVIFTRFQAVSLAYAEEPLGMRVRTLFGVIPYDLLLIGVLLFLAAAANRLTISSSRRVIVTGLIYIAEIFFLLLTFVNLEVFRELGSPLKYHLLLLAPSVGKDLVLRHGAGNISMLAYVPALVALSVLATPWLTQRLRPFIFNERGLTRIPWAAALLAAGVGGALCFVPPSGLRETALRDMNLFKMLLPQREATLTVAPETPAEHRIVQLLCGPEHTDGQKAFQMLKPQKYNIVLWVCESVGARYLKSLHPLGEVETPCLDSAMTKGALRFSNCFVECPLTIQTAWTLVTGLSPPGRPMIFTCQQDLPTHGPMLPALLKKAGYESVSFNSGFTSIWGTDKLFREAGFDINEDANELINRNKFKCTSWGTEDEAIVDRLGLWLDSRSAKDVPFFAMLWNIETHYPYDWVAIPEEMKKGPEKKRYFSGIKRLDRLLGSTFDLLSRHNLSENTIVVIIGDHGEGQGRAPGRPYERSHSMLVFEDSIHVPLIFLNPQFSKPIDVQFNCTPADVLPTILSLAGVETPPDSAGRSLTKPYTNQPQFSRSILWWPLSSRAGKYKLLLDNATAKPELYDIQSDNQETHDLADSEVDITNALMCGVIRMAAERYKTDGSFKYESSLMNVFGQKEGPRNCQPTEKTVVPTVQEMLKPEEPTKK